MITKDSPAIHSYFESNIVWKKNIEEPVLQSTEIHVWNVKVPEHFCNLYKDYRSILNKQEFYKAQRFYWEADFRSYVTARIVLRLLLCRYSGSSLNDLRFDFANSKPTLISKTPLKYNLSYGGKHILISIGRCETGIDIEEMKQNLDFREILDSCFSQDEIRNINGDSKKSREEFFLQWTRKEALLKYTGQGIVDDLADIPSMDGKYIVDATKLHIRENVNLKSFLLDHNTTGSLVFPEYISQVQYIQW